MMIEINILMMKGMVFLQNKRVDRFIMKNSWIHILIKEVFLREIILKNTGIFRVYSGRKQKATGFVYLKSSQYCDDERPSQLRSCLQYAIINAAPRIGKNWQSGILLTVST